MCTTCIIFHYALTTTYLSMIYIIFYRAIQHKCCTFKQEPSSISRYLIDRLYSNQFLLTQSILCTTSMQHARIGCRRSPDSSKAPNGRANSVVNLLFRESFDHPHLPTYYTNSKNKKSPLMLSARAQFTYSNYPIYPQQMYGFPRH